MLYTTPENPCAGNRGHGQQMSHRALTFSSTLTPPPLDSQWAPSRTRGLPRGAHHHDELLLARPAAWNKAAVPISKRNQQAFELNKEKQGKQQQDQEKQPGRAKMMKKQVSKCFSFSLLFWICEYDVMFESEW